jgi:hypothetical protein
MKDIYLMMNKSWLAARGVEFVEACVNVVGWNVVGCAS